MIKSLAFETYDSDFKSVNSECMLLIKFISINVK